MIIDPRTQRPVTMEGDCHLIPESIEYGNPPRPVSNKTVPLDGPFDNKIGAKCDHHLKKYLDMLVGDDLKGEFSFELDFCKPPKRLSHMRTDVQFDKPVPAPFSR